MMMTMNMVVVMMMMIMNKHNVKCTGTDHLQSLLDAVNYVECIRMHSTVSESTSSSRYLQSTFYTWHSLLNAKLWKLQCTVNCKTLDISNFIGAFIYVVYDQKSLACGWCIIGHHEEKSELTIMNHNNCYETTEHSSGKKWSTQLWSTSKYAWPLIRGVLIDGNGGIVTTQLRCSSLDILVMYCNSEWELYRRVSARNIFRKKIHSVLVNVHIFSLSRFWLAK